MKPLPFRFIFLALSLAGGPHAMAVEEAKYEVIEQHGPLEIRKYAPYVLAETVVSGKIEEAGNKAFQILFGYIAGQNKAKQKLAMTAPVSQETPGQKIAMTAPVSQESAGNDWAVSFMMPAGFKMETTPEPLDPRVTLRQVPERHVAAIRYSGTWSEERYERHRGELEAWIHKRGLTPTGGAVWARYDPPFTLWFLRRNEVIIPIKPPPAQPGQPTIN